MKPKPLIVANWKMNIGLQSEADAFLDAFIPQLNTPSIDVGICPPFTVLEHVSRRLKNTNVQCGAQNCHYEASGAFTGEVSPAFLKNLCHFVIIGHSERRHVFGESNEWIGKKIKAALAFDLTPIFCIGETEAQRLDHLTFQTITDQLMAALANLTAAELKRVVIAYEPVWAIGTGRTATPEQAQEVHHFIRQWLVERFENVAASIHILYGGSVKPANARELLDQPDINGALVGGASLKPQEFLEIIQA